MPGTDDMKNLNAAFVEDHRNLIRGYRDAKQAIEASDLQSARIIAEQLDMEAGPHIEFEECCLYPIVAAARGKEYASRLYHEHAATLQTLTELRHATTITESDRMRWLSGLQEGLEHAATCGTLLSHLETQPPEKQAELMEKLRAFRKQDLRWSRLATNRDAHNSRS